MTSVPKSQSKGLPSVDEALQRDAAQSRIMKRLASTLRHDLNSPLQAAVWAFDLIERGLATHPDTEQRARIGTSVELGRRELARLQKAVRLFVACAAPLDDRSEHFDVRDLLGEIERLLVAEATLRDVRMEFKEQAQPLDVTGVRHHVQQALLLLALEALDSCAGGGQIDVEPREGTGSVEIRLTHTLNGSHPGVAAASDLGERVVEAVASAHGGKLTRNDHEGRREITLTLARR